MPRIKYCCLVICFSICTAHLLPAQTPVPSLASRAASESLNPASQTVSKDPTFLQDRLQTLEKYITFLEGENEKLKSKMQLLESELSTKNSQNDQAQKLLQYQKTVSKFQETQIEKLGEIISEQKKQLQLLMKPSSKSSK